MRHGEITIMYKSRSHANGLFRGIGNLPNKQKTPDSARAEIGRFFASEYSLALLAGNFAGNFALHN